MAETNTISMINELRKKLFILECNDFDEQIVLECNQIYTQIQKLELNLLIEYLDFKDAEIVDVVNGLIDLLNQFQELNSKWGKYSKFNILVKTLYGKRETSEAPFLIQKLFLECKKMLFELDSIL